MILENAAISLEAVRDLLEREGRTEDALTLRGLEIVNPAGAEVALDALRNIRPDSPDTLSTLEWAMYACRAATRSFRLAVA